MNAVQPLPSPAPRPLTGRDRGAGTPVHPPATGDFGRARPGSLANPPRQQYLLLRAGVHRKLLNRLNLEALAQADRGRAESEIRTLLLELLSEEATPLSLSERDTLFAEILDDVFGLGPLEPLLRDPTISDILVNTCKNMFVERNGVLERVDGGVVVARLQMLVADRIAQ